MLKPNLLSAVAGLRQPAAFGRLCVETLGFDFAALSDCQPPSGGCVLKLSLFISSCGKICQPPSGGCVLKQDPIPLIRAILTQPPSGGCVLKLAENIARHCAKNQPPSGGCVLKQSR